MPDITASIAARGCNATGITEELVDRLHLGKKLMAVVELEANAHTEKSDGKEKMQLRIVNVEPAPNKDTEDHLRELQRSFYYERKVALEGPQLVNPGEGSEPSTADVLAQGEQYLPHEFTPDEKDDRICNICGSVSIANVHTAALEEEEPENDEPDEPEED